MILTNAETIDRHAAATDLRLCFVGHMLGRNPGYITTQGQIVSDLLQADGYNVSCVSSKLNRLHRLADVVLTLARRSRQLDVVVVETFSGPSFMMADVASLVCKLFGLPIVMFLHGGNLPAFAKRHPRWMKRVLNRAERLAAPSEFLADHFRELGYQVVVIPNVLEIAGYPYRERNEVGPRLLWMRSFDHVYNPHMAVRVFASVRKHLPNASLTMAGVDKGLRSDVEALATRMGVADSIRFAGFLDAEAKIAEFAKADIYINTNRVDNMPVSVLEARAFGLPVVSTNVGGIPYVIKDGVDGMLVADDDHEAMAESIRDLVSDADLARRISQRGREIAERSDWSSVRTEWESLFAEVSEPGRTRDLSLGAVDQQC